MSLFQCDKCGCCENTALSDGARMYLWDRDNVPPEVDAAWKEFVGMEWRGKEFCSACNPVWFTEDGDFGIGPNPDAKWHGKFTRQYYPVGSMMTGRDGNLVRRPQ